MWIISLYNVLIIVECDDNILQRALFAGHKIVIPIFSLKVLIFADILLQRKMGASDIQPPDTASLEAARELRLKEIAMEAILKEVLVYFLFVTVVFFLSYQARDADSFLFTSNIRNNFVFNNPSFDSVSTKYKYKYK